MKESNGSKKRMFTIFGLLLVILTISGSCSKSSMDNMTGTTDPGTKGTPGTNEVWIQGMAFDPANITVRAGATITWTNKDDVVHTVTSNNGLFDSGSLSTNGTYSRLFSTPGVYFYHCTPHPSMTATVTVN